MNGRPTLAELRRRVFKHSTPHLRPGDPPPREIGNWLARRVGRPSAVYGTWLAVRLGLSAHQVTAMALAANLGAALAIGTGTRAGFLAGVALAWLGYWLDHVDGQVARWRGTSSLGGVYLDYLMHHAASLALGYALGHGLAARTGMLGWAAAGWLAGAGWLFLGLHNDCRYKAFFQRLKRESRSFRVDGGVGGRPEPPAGWPRRGRSAVTWPAYKVCEPHAVLLAITAMGFAAMVDDSAWSATWPTYVAAMAVLAPTLAIARSARAVVRDAPGAEFDRWFRPSP